MEEPSVLDYIKAKLTPWRGPAPQIPPLPGSTTSSIPAPIEPVTIQLEISAPSSLQPALSQGPAPAIATSAQARPAVRVGQIAWPWRALLALLLALIAQASLEPHPDRTATLGIVIYVFAAVALIWSTLSREWVLEDLKPESDSVIKVQADGKPIDYYRFILHPSALILSLVSAFGAFL